MVLFSWFILFMMVLIFPFFLNLTKLMRTNQPNETLCGHLWKESSGNGMYPIKYFQKYFKRVIRAFGYTYRSMCATNLCIQNLKLVHSKFQNFKIKNLCVQNPKHNSTRVIKTWNKAAQLSCKPVVIQSNRKQSLNPDLQTNWNSPYNFIHRQ